MPNYEIVTMKNKVTVKCANQKMEQDLVITYKDALSSENALKKLLDYTKSCNHMFYDNNTITDLTDYFEYSDTENVTTMNSMFYGAQKLTTIPQLDTKNVTTMEKTFYECNSLTTIPQLNTGNVTNTRYMFFYNKKLTTIPQLDTKNITTMDYMFQDCIILEKIDFTSMDKITNTSATTNLAKNCYSLKKFIIRTMSTIPVLNSYAFSNCYHLTGTVNETYNPNGDKDCFIYVPDDYVEQLKSATNWSTYADQIKGLSELVED